METDKVLDQIISSLKNVLEIDLIILSGSRRSSQTTDFLSDYDLALYSSNPQSLLRDKDLIQEIMPVWLIQKNQFTYSKWTIPSRLVFYQQGIKIDYSFWPTEVIHKHISEGLPDHLEIGYEIVLDRNGLGSLLPVPQGKGYLPQEPTKEQFQENFQNFWFELFCWARYLYRGDLFFAQKVANTYLKDYLLEMLIWYQFIKGTTKNRIHTQGKRMEDWLEADVWVEIKNIYSSADIAESWKALFSHIDIYRKISGEVAEHYSYQYDFQLDQQLNSYLKKLNRDSQKL